MMEATVAALFVVALWWLSTGLVLRLVWLPRRAHPAIVVAFTLVALLGLYGAVVTSALDTRLGSYLGFLSALGIWSWHEVTFLLGVITGPRKEPCPPGAAGWTRFRLATATVIHHEVALAVTALGLIWATWSSPTPVATWTFVVLWLMRLSAKLNIYLGVRNVSSEEFVPRRLRYLVSYFRQAPLSPLMTLTLGGGTVALHLLVLAAGDPEVSQGVATGCVLTLTLLALALVEHLFLAFPLNEAVLWRWLVRSESRKTTANNVLAEDP